MQIKRFEAQDMAQALRLIKTEFGPDAVILSAKTLKNAYGNFGFLKRPRVEVTAATDTPNPEAKKRTFSSQRFTLKELVGKRRAHHTFGQEGERLQQKRNVEDLAPLRQCLIAQGVKEEIARELVEEMAWERLLSKSPRNDELKSCLIRTLEEKGICVERVRIGKEKQKIVAFVGPTGTGKTTTVAKLAAVASQSNKQRKVGVITLDNQRIGGVEQLRIYAQIIGIPFGSVADNKGLKYVLKRFKNIELILIDTASVSLRNEGEIAELRRSLKEIRDLETHLVLSATTKESDLEDLTDRFEAVPIDRLLFTKLDESISYGNILNQAFRMKIPMSYFTNGRGVPEDIEVATLDRLVELMVEAGKGEKIWFWPENEKRENERQRPAFNRYYRSISTSIAT
jgi:flagellar biosynthesis protein FlhF